MGEKLAYKKRKKIKNGHPLWMEKKKNKIPAVYASQSKSETTLHTTYQGLYESIVSVFDRKTIIGCYNVVMSVVAVIIISS